MAQLDPIWNGNPSLTGSAGNATYGAGGLASTGSYITNNTNGVFVYNGDPTITTTSGAGGSLTVSTGAVPYVNYADAEFDQEEEENLWNS